MGVWINLEQFSIIQDPCTNQDPTLLHDSRTGPTPFSSRPKTSSAFLHGTNSWVHLCNKSAWPVAPFLCGSSPGLAGSPLMKMTWRRTPKSREKERSWPPETRLASQRAESHYNHSGGRHSHTACVAVNCCDLVVDWGLLGSSEDLSFQSTQILLITTGITGSRSISARWTQVFRVRFLTCSFPPPKWVRERDGEDGQGTGRDP